jgi:hypothetical protein
MINYNNKKYYSTFLLICFLLIIFALLKKNYLYKYYEKEHFINFPTPYKNLKNMLSLSDYEYNNENLKGKVSKNIKKGIKKSKKGMKDVKKEGKSVDKGFKGKNKKTSSSNTQLSTNQTKALISQQLKTAISSLSMPPGSQGPQGQPGPAGGLYQNKGYFTSNSNIKKMKPLKMAMAMKPIGKVGSPVLFSDSDYSSDRKWMMNPDGTITNQYLGNKYCLSLNQDNSTDAGKYSLLELVSTEDGNCTQFHEDNNSRLKVKNTNNCMTVKKTSSMKGLNLSVPNTKECSLSEIANSECDIEDNSEVLGIDVCNNIIKSDQTFVWL